MECFGDSSDDEDEADNETNIIKRDESCGLCCFHSNTEASLLTHVSNSLKTAPSSTDALSDEQNKLQRSSSVLDAIDTFCMSRHWMMHVGPEKGDILLEAMQDAMNNKAKHSSSLDSNTIPFVAVELGTYCGYASILMGREFCKSKPENLNCHLFTTEIHREYAEIATEMIQLSGMEDLISVHQISFDGHDTDLVSVVSDAMRKNNPRNISNQANITIDFLFIDHDKDAYKTDLCKLEASGLICSGTKVVADNVLFASIDDYVGYVQQRMKEGIVETRTIPCHVEYSGGNNESGGEPHQDGVEITDYLRDP